MTSRPPVGRSRCVRLTLAAAILLAALGRGARVTPLAQLPPLARVEGGKYRASNARTGEKLWRHHWILRRETGGGRTTVEVTQEGRGRRDGANNASWLVTVQFVSSATVRRLSTRREVRDARGRVRMEDRELDYVAATCRAALQAGPAGRTEMTSFPVTERTIDVEFLAVAPRLVPDAEGQRMRFDLVTSDSWRVPMEARSVGRDVVEVPAGRFDCYKIEIAPTGLLGVPADLLLPRMHMWHTIASPHIWERSRGAEGGVGSPEILRELTRFESSQE